MFASVLAPQYHLNSIRPVSFLRSFYGASTVIYPEIKSFYDQRNLFVVWDWSTRCWRLYCFLLPLLCFRYNNSDTFCYNILIFISSVFLDQRTKYRSRKIYTRNAFDFNAHFSRGCEWRSTLTCRLKITSGSYFLRFHKWSRYRDEDHFQ